MARFLVVKCVNIFYVNNESQAVTCHNMLRKASSESNVTKKQMDKVGKYLVKTRSGYGEPDIPAAALYPQCVNSVCFIKLIK